MAKPPKETAPAPQDEAARLKAAEEAAKLKTSKSARKKAEEEDDDDDDDDDDDEDEDDDDDEELSPHVVSATETRNALKIMGRFLAPFIPAHKKGISLILVAVVIETIYNTSFPLLLKFLIDDAINADDPRMLIIILSTMFGLGVVSSIVMVWFEWLNADTGSAMIRDIRNRLFDHSQAAAGRLLPQEQDRRGAAALLGRHLAARGDDQPRHAMGRAAAVRAGCRHRHDVLPQLAAGAGGAAPFPDRHHRPALPRAEAARQATR